MFLFSLKNDENIQKLDSIYIVPLYIVGISGILATPQQFWQLLVH